MLSLLLASCVELPPDLQDVGSTELEVCPASVALPVEGAQSPVEEDAVEVDLGSRGGLTVDLALSVAGFGPEVSIESCVGVGCSLGVPELRALETFDGCAGWATARWFLDRDLYTDWSQSYAEWACALDGQTEPFTIRVASLDPETYDAGELTQTVELGIRLSADAYEAYCGP